MEIILRSLYMKGNYKNEEKREKDKRKLKMNNRNEKMK